MLQEEVADYYDKTFMNHPNILTPKRAENSTHVFHQYTLRILNGKKMNYKRFSRKEIPAMIYYPVALESKKHITKSLMMQIL